MNILVINAGSSSLKYQLIDMKKETVLAKGLAERIRDKKSNIKHKTDKIKSIQIPKPMKSHEDAIKMMIELITHDEYGVISSTEEINAVGHRVVHGGEEFSSSAIIDDEVIKAIESNIHLAPLHNPANLMGIKACKKIIPNAKMAAVFDTAFHQTMPKIAYLYAIPYEMYTEKKIRRYGFHGSSHRYIATRAAELLGKNIADLKLINCHLGNGSSVCAIDGGKSVDTSMGMTPLEGLMMGTRCGDIDPSIIKSIMDGYNLTVDEVMDVLNSKSGLLGLSQLSSDKRDLIKAARQGNLQCEITLKALEYQIKKYIGAYAAAMNGVDAIVFTAGIGENDVVLRKNVIQGLSFFGLKLDEKKNASDEHDIDISASDSAIRILKISTNEELMIARDTLSVIDDSEK